MTISKIKVANKIAKLTKQIEGFDFDNPANIKANADYTKTLLNITDLSETEINTFLNTSDKISPMFSARNELEQLQTTIDSELMKCEHKYVVTNTKSLISPAGFHPESLVFMQTEIAIHTDSLDNIPASNVDLYGHELTRAII